MAELTSGERIRIIRRRGYKSAKDGKKYPISQLEIHHMNRNPENNNPENLKVLTKKQHKDLHARAGD